MPNIKTYAVSFLIAKGSNQMMIREIFFDNAKGHLDHSHIFKVPNENGQKIFNMEDGLNRLVREDFDIENALKKAEIFFLEDVYKSEIGKRLFKLFDIKVVIEDIDPFDDMSGCVNPNLQDPISMHENDSLIFIDGNNDFSNVEEKTEPVVFTGRGDIEGIPISQIS